MRLAVVQRGARTTHDVIWTLALGGSGERVDPDGAGEWRGQFTDHGTYRELRLEDDSLPTTIDGRRLGRQTILTAGMEIAFGEVRILVEYDGPLAPEPPLSATEADLLQRIAEGDDDAAVVLADHWGDARGAFITAQRAGIAAEPDPRWLANLHAASFAGACVRGFAVPLALDESEPLEAWRMSPRCYRVGAFCEDSTRTLVFDATAAGPRRALGRFALQVPHVEEKLVARTSRIVARLDHPHLARHAGAVAHRRGLGFAMAWAGEPLARSQLGSVALAHDLGRQLCAALRELAALRIAHNAIEPSHVLLAEGHATLVGFGNATTPDIPPLLPDTRSGTLPNEVYRYWTPERVRNEVARFSTASDLFALAGLLVEIATGTHPFGGHANPMNTLAAVVAGQYAIRGDTIIERLARATLVVTPSARPTLDEFEAALR